MSELFRPEEKFQEIMSLPELEDIHKKGKLFGFKAVKEDAYHAGPGLSQSILKGYLETPAHAKMAMNGAKTRTDAMKLGSACHAAVFEPGRFEREFYTAPNCDRRTKEGKARWESLLNANPGKEILSEDDGETIAGILRTLRSHDYFRYISDGHGAPELAFYWNMAGHFCKARFDWITTTLVPLPAGEQRIIFDLKTTDYGLKESQLKHTIYNLGYHIQAAWYLSAIPDADFWFIFAGKRPPYPVAFYQVGPKMREEGHAEIEKLLAIHNECTARGTWPAHNNSVILGD